MVDRAVELRVQSLVIKQGFDGHGIVSQVYQDAPERYRFEVTYPKRQTLWLVWDEKTGGPLIRKEHEHVDEEEISQKEERGGRRT